MGRLPARRGVTRPRRAAQAQRARRCSSASAWSGSTRGTPVEETVAGRPPARRDRQGARGQPARADLRRADDGAVGARDEGAARAASTGCATRATRSCTSRHHLEEMFEIGDRVTILRDGKFVTTAPMGELRPRRPDRLDGRPQDRVAVPARPSARVGEPRLKVVGLKPAGVEEPIDFEVRAGEILGIAGLLGSGRSELLRAIFGADPVEGGHIEVDGERVAPGEPAHGRAGRARPADRGPQARSGCCSSCRSARTPRSPHLDEISRFWLVDKKRERNLVDQYLGGLQLRAGSWEQPVSSLSGGNQQKVLLARWLATKAKVLLFDEPTKGVDVGAKAEIYKVIGDLAAEGLGVIVVSSYLPEVLGLADRVLVMREGGVAGELPGGRRDRGGRPAARQPRCGGPRGRGPDRGDGSTSPQATEPAAAGAATAHQRREERVLTFGDVFGRDAGGLIVLLVLFGAHDAGLGRVPDRRQHGQPLPPGGDLRDHRRRPAAGHPHRGHRPVGRLGARPDRLRHRRAARRTARRSCSRSSSASPSAPRSACSTASLVAYGKLPPFIVTLGMLGIARGVVLVLTDASTVQPLPDAFGNIANGDFLGLPNLLWMFVVVVVRHGVRAAPHGVRPLHLRGRLQPGVRAPGGRAGDARARRRLRDRRPARGGRRRAVHLAPERRHPDGGHGLRAERDRRVRDRRREPVRRQGRRLRGGGRRADRRRRSTTAATCWPSTRSTCRSSSAR